MIATYLHKIKKKNIVWGSCRRNNKGCLFGGLFRKENRNESISFRSNRRTNI